MHSVVHQQPIQKKCPASIVCHQNPNYLAVGGIIQFICHTLCSIKLNTAGVNTFYLQAQRDSQTDTLSRLDAFREMWEWERVWKITQPKYGVVNSWLFPSSAPNGCIRWLHYCLNRNCIYSELWRKIPSLRKSEIITNHSPTEITKEEKRTWEKTKFFNNETFPVGQWHLF